MWINFRSGDEKNDGRRPSCVTVPPKTMRKSTPSPSSSTLQHPQGRDKATKSLNRQNSSQSSCKSTSSNIQKKMEEMSFQKQTGDWQKEQQYNATRMRNKRIDKELDSKARLRCIRRLYIPASIFMFLGIVMLFGATLRSLSYGTFMWIHRKHFSVIGPSVLAVGIIFLLIAIACENRTVEKLKGKGDIYRDPLLHEDFILEDKGMTRNYSQNSWCVSESPNRSNSKQRLYESKIDGAMGGEDSFLCNSMSSVGTMQTLHETENMSRQTGSLGMRNDERGDSNTFRQCLAASGQYQDRSGSTQGQGCRTEHKPVPQLYSTPSIEVTDVDTISEECTSDVWHKI